MIRMDGLIGMLDSTTAEGTRMILDKLIGLDLSSKGIGEC
jgi:hypothetical protein